MPHALRCAALLAGVAAVAAEGTTLAFGRRATEDGSTIVTHSADCSTCDFRLALTPARSLDADARAPVYRLRDEYPRYVTDDRGETWRPGALEEGTHTSTWKSAAWGEKQVLGTIPQVSRTFALYEAQGGVMNARQVSVGFSSCAAAIGAEPRACADCEGPLFDAAALSLFALERCASARCAVEVMGRLALDHGFYGAADSLGDALTIADGRDVWLFHVLADDTGSAVWAAQRLPEGHVSVCAGDFVIRGVGSDTAEFLHSPNIWDVAARTGLLVTQQGTDLVDFRKTFGRSQRRSDGPRADASAGRVWRVFDLLAPSLRLEAPFSANRKVAAAKADALPVSVAVEHKVSLSQVLQLLRDHFDGTPWDLTKGLAAGPWGDPGRLEAGAGPQGTGAHTINGFLDASDAKSGAFPRAVAVSQTSWATVAQARAFLPDAVGGRLWFAPYSPSSGAFVPLYCGAGGSAVPLPLAFGSPYRFDPASQYWANCAVGNWMRSAWAWSAPLVRQAQKEVEEAGLAASMAIEARCLQLLRMGHAAEAAAELQRFSEETALAALARWQLLFLGLLSSNRDGLIFDQSEATITATSLFYPLRWLELVGYYDPEVQERGSAAGNEDALLHAPPAGNGSLSDAPPAADDGAPPTPPSPADAAPADAAPASAPASAPAADDDLRQRVPDLGPAAGYDGRRVPLLMKISPSRAGFSGIETALLASVAAAVGACLGWACAMRFAAAASTDVRSPAVQFDRIGLEVAKF
ncbi:peptidase family C69-domain-containing protein [Pelagophyceae sp. CCMP2097]|nr:peptidase family C69-domain-containing protein [Pelagophyceae sp. CCMP2097]